MEALNCIMILQMNSMVMFSSNSLIIYIHLTFYITQTLQNKLERNLEIALSKSFLNTSDY